MSRTRVIRLDRPQYERTDPDYLDKRLTRMAADYHACPPEWRETFLAGLTRTDYQALCEKLQIIKAKKK